MYGIIEYPKALYHEDGSTCLVQNEEEDQRAVSEYGFMESPKSSPPPQATHLSNYKPIEYPKAMYHSGLPSRTVNDADEQAAAEEVGYTEAPGGVPELRPAKAAKVVEVVEVVAPAVEAEDAAEADPFGAPLADAIEYVSDETPAVIEVPSDDITPKKGRPTKMEKLLKIQQEAEAAAQKLIEKAAKKAAKAAKK